MFSIHLKFYIFKSTLNSLDASMKCHFCVRTQSIQCHNKWRIPFTIQFHSISLTVRIRNRNRDNWLRCLCYIASHTIVKRENIQKLKSMQAWTCRKYSKYTRKLVFISMHLLISSFNDGKLSQAIKSNELNTIILSPFIHTHTHTHIRRVYFTHQWQSLIELIELIELRLTIKLLIDVQPKMKSFSNIKCVKCLQTNKCFTNVHKVIIKRWWNVNT